MSCGRGLSKWSADLAALDARIVDTFRLRAGPAQSAEVTVIGSGDA